MFKKATAMNKVWSKGLSFLFTIFFFLSGVCEAPDLLASDYNDYNDYNIIILVSLTPLSLILSEQSDQSQVLFFCEQVKSVNGKPLLLSISGSPGQKFNNSDKLGIKWA